MLGGAAFAASVGVVWLDLTSFEQEVRLYFVGAVAPRVDIRLIGGTGRAPPPPDPQLVQLLCREAHPHPRSSSRPTGGALIG